MASEISPTYEHGSGNSETVEVLWGVVWRVARDKPIYLFKNIGVWRSSSPPHGLDFSE